MKKDFCIDVCINFKSAFNLYLGSWSQSPTLQDEATEIPTSDTRNVVETYVDKAFTPHSLRTVFWPRSTVKKVCYVF
jgi:hypothetical protein